MPTDPQPSRSTSLYRCDKCGAVVRDWAGNTSLGHVHNDERGNYAGKDAEGKFIEFEDDGRDVDDDLTDPDTIWLA